MRIGFDAKRAVQNFTGLGNYSRFVIEALTRQNNGDEYYLYSPKPPKSQLLTLEHAAIRFRYPQKNTSKSYWRSRGIVKDLKADGIDIFHGLSNEMPFGLSGSGIRSVVTVHDLIFLRYPHYYPWFDRKIYQIKFKYACRNADKIIAVSEQTKQDIVSFFSIPEKRIEVIYQDCSDLFKASYSESDKQQIKIKYKLPDRFLLSVGTIESRKNLMLIVQALKTVRNDVGLVVVGKETAYAEEVKSFLRQNNLVSRVSFLNNVSYQDLPLIYRQADIFIYPSRFEGFGIPVVEALHSEVPVIAATGSCLEEAGGKGSIYVHPDDENALSNAVNGLLEDPGKKKQMIRAGLLHAKQFSKEIIAGKLTKLYQDLKDA